MTKKQKYIKFLNENESFQNWIKSSPFQIIGFSITEIFLMFFSRNLFSWVKTFLLFFIMEYTFSKVSEIFSHIFYTLSLMFLKKYFSFSLKSLKF